MNEVNCSESGAAKRSVFNRFVMRLKWLWPWLIVKWMYCEIENGSLILKKEGTQYLWKVYLTYAAVLFCNQCLSWIGYPHKRGNFFICDA